PRAEDVAAGARTRRPTHPRMGEAQPRAATAGAAELSARQATGARRTTGAVGTLSGDDAGTAFGVAHQRFDQQHRRAARGRTHRAGEAGGAAVRRDREAQRQARAAPEARRPLMPRRALAPAADPWRRFMGFAYEAIILFGLVWFADYAFSALTQFRGHPGALRTTFPWLTLGVLAVYFTSFWSEGRRSPPMKTMHLQLQTRGGRHAP